MGHQLLETVKSVNNIPLRLTDERWSHITEEHTELAGYKYQVLEAVSRPDFIVRGRTEELIAVKEVESGKHIVVVYKEANRDGFVITAFLTRRVGKIKEREIIWLSTS